MSSSTSRKYHKWTKEDIDMMSYFFGKYNYAEAIRRLAIALELSELAVASKYQKEVEKGNVLGKDYKTRQQISDETLEKDLLIKDFLHKRISENPNNISKCIKETADEFGIHASTISNKWYGTAGYKNSIVSRNNEDPVYSVIGKTVTINGKNQDEPTTRKISWITAILMKITKRKK